jgi:hypothetical protein
MVDPYEVVQSNFEAKPVANMWCRISENYVLAPHCITRYLAVVYWMIIDTAPVHFGRKIRSCGTEVITGD